MSEEGRRLLPDLALTSRPHRVRSLSPTQLCGCELQALCGQASGGALGFISETFGSLFLIRFGGSDRLTLPRHRDSNITLDVLIRQSDSEAPVFFSTQLPRGLSHRYLILAKCQYFQKHRDTSILVK